MKSIRHLITGVALAAIAAGWAGAAVAQESIQVWFTKGFYKGEDDALIAVVDKFQKATGVKVDLSLYATEDCVTKSVGAVQAGTPPDVGFCTTYDFRTTGQWAFEGKLEDVSDVLEPLKAEIQPQALATTFLMNDKTKKKAYYAFPVQQQMMHITYWKDMLEEAGFKESDIPKGWNGYWDFWCDKVQAGLRAKGKRVYAVGHPMGVAASDTFYSFLTFANAFGAQVVDENGKIVLDQPKNKAAMIETVKAYANILQRGCTPPSSVNWLDPDNNVAFHNKTTVMTHNATISIAAKHLDDMNNPALTQEQRDQAKKNYLRQHPHRRIPQQARWQQDDQPRRREDRGGLRRRQEQEARQGIHGLHDEGRESASLRRGFGRALVPDHASRPPRPRSGRATIRTARSCRSSTPTARPVPVRLQLQVHGRERRERLGQGRQPRRAGQDRA